MIICTRELLLSTHTTGFFELPVWGCVVFLHVVFPMANPWERLQKTTVTSNAKQHGMRFLTTVFIQMSFLRRGRGILWGFLQAPFGALLSSPPLMAPQWVSMASPRLWWRPDLQPSPRHDLEAKAFYLSCTKAHSAQESDRGSEAIKQNSSAEALGKENKFCTEGWWNINNKNSSCCINVTYKHTLNGMGSKKTQTPYET